MNRTRGVCRLAATVLTAALPLTTADAATFAFTGARENVNPVNPPRTGRCALTYVSTMTIVPGDISSTGSSNFGAFTATMSHCNVTPPPTALVDGVFAFDFAAGDGLFGVYTGSIGLGGTTCVFTAIQNMTFTGGTGRFLGATGLLDDVGTLRGGNVGGRPVGIFEGAVRGALNLPAGPEPATWMTMILGFGAIGAALRRRGHEGLDPVAAPTPASQA